MRKSSFKVTFFSDKNISIHAAETVQDHFSAALPRQPALLIPRLKGQVMREVRLHVLQLIFLPPSWNHLCFAQTQTSFLQMYDYRVW